MSQSKHASGTSVDEFGLPNISLLAECFETAEAKARRIKKVQAFARRAYNAVAGQLGQEVAVEIFAAAAKNSKKPAGRRKQVGVDNELYRIYNLERSRCIENGDEKSIPSLPRRISTKIYADGRRDYGKSASAIEKRIRRILEGSKADLST